MVGSVPARGDVTTTARRMLFRAPGYARPMFYDRGTPYDVRAD